MGILSVILLGLIVGALAKFIMPGDDPGGIFITIGIGIAGALVGGFIANLFGIAPTDDFSVGDRGRSAPALRLPPIQELRGGPKNAPPLARPPRCALA